MLRKFEIANGLCYDLELVTPVWLTGQETSEVARENLTGLRMAPQALGMEKWLVGDVIELECTPFSRPIEGTTASTSKSTSIVRTNRPSERANT